MELEVPQRPIFKPTLSTIMVQRVLQWERQKSFSRCKCQRTMAEKCRFNILNRFFFLPNVSIVTRKEGKKKGTRSNMKKIPKLPFLDTY